MKIQLDSVVDALDGPCETANAEMCLEDYMFAMKKMISSVGNSLCYELFGFTLLITALSLIDDTVTVTRLRNAHWN